MMTNMEIRMYALERAMELSRPRTGFAEWFNGNFTPIRDLAEEIESYVKNIALPVGKQDEANSTNTVTYPTIEQASHGVDRMCLSGGIVVYDTEAAIKAFTIAHGIVSALMIEKQEMEKEND